MTVLLIAVLTAAITASTLQAQERSCKDVAGRVASGRPAPGDLSTLAHCIEERSSALASGVRRLAGETDANTLRDVTFAASMVVDADVHEALRTVALSGAPRARAYALCAVAGHEEGAPTVAFQRVGPIAGYSCAAVLTERSRQVRGQPLSQAHRESAHQLAQQILADASTPPEIRPAALFLSSVTGSSQATATQVQPPEPGKVRLVYACEKKFWVRNSNRTPVEVVYEVEGTPERATLTVPGAIAGTEYAQFGLWTRQGGTVRLLFDGNVIQTAANENRPCEP